jgi:uncharacterized lipoprotein NlpE involved in copper resistance
MTNRSILAIALLVLSAAGCNNREAEAEGHTETHNRVSGMSESSAGLPKGSVEAGEKLANLKRERITSHMRWRATASAAATMRS